jgi:hypothetical protein
MYRMLVKVLFFGCLAATMALGSAWLLLGASPWAVFLGWAALACLASALIFYRILKPPLLPLANHKGKLDLKWSEEPLACLLCPPESWDGQDGGSPSFVWLSALAKEVGPCRPLESVQDLPQATRLLVVPAGVELDTDRLARLEDLARGGGVIILECPGPSLTTLSGLGPVSGSEQAHRVVTKEGEIQLWGGVMARVHPNAQAEPVWRSPAGHVLLYRHDLGQGAVFSLTFSHGRWAARVLHGFPWGSEENLAGCFSLQHPQSHSLQALAAETRKFDPVVDMLESALFTLARDAALLPALWYHPGGQAARCAITFDEDFYGDRCLQLSPLPQRSTWFLTSEGGLGREAARELAARGACFGLHWNRFRVHLTKLGVHFCRASLGQQAQALRGMLGDVISNRTHYLLWEKKSWRTFQALAEAGIRWDSSFGPGQWQHGYTFGTGFPFLAAGQDGRPLGIWELPFQVHHPMGRPTVEETRRLLDEALARHHTCVVALFHPYYCLPEAVTAGHYHALLEATENRAGLGLATLEDIAVAWESRLATRACSTRKGSATVLDIETPCRQTLRLPLPDRLERLMVNGRERPPGLLLALDPGRHQITMIHHQ